MNTDPSYNARLYLKNKIERKKKKKTNKKNTYLMKAGNIRRNKLFCFFSVEIIVH